MTTQFRTAETDVASRTASFVKAKFQVGSAKSDKINYAHSQKVFHKGDIPESVLEAKQDVIKSVEPNILETEEKDWNQSTLLNYFAVKGGPRLHREESDLKRKLLHVRAGLLDQPNREGGLTGGRPQEEIDGLIRYIVSITGKGPIGFLTKKWYDANDERRCMKHTCHEDREWKTWRESTATGTKWDQQEREKIFEEKEKKRVEMNIPDKFIFGDYNDPVKQVDFLGDRIREKKIEYQDLKETFKKELKTEYPNASEERLQAMAARLLDEKLRADEKLQRFPLKHESFRPNLSLTSIDRRYKESFHQGKWCFSEVEQRFCWSCCLNTEQKSKGCESRTVNPDSWCLINC